MRHVGLLLMTLMPLSAFCQGWHFNAELGTNVSGLPWRDNLGGGNERGIPKVRPVFGVHFQRSSRVGLYAELGVRYVNTGTRIVYHRSTVDPLTQIPYTTDREENFSFGRLSYGLELGYQFPIPKFKLILMTGYRKNFYTSGRYRYTYSVRYDDGNRFDQEKLYNPFRYPNLDIKADPNGWEVYAGVGVGIGKRFTTVVQYALTDDITFTENSRGHTSDDWHAYVANDLCLSLIYKLTH